MDCPQCHISNPSGGKFCVQCGSGLESTVRPKFRDRRCEAIFHTLDTALAPKFELLDSIGSGGMGYVFLALHRQLNSKVAIKVLHESCNSDPALVTRFHREAKAAAQLSHPNIIPIFDIGVAADFNYFVMMYIEGEDLDSVLVREGALPLQKALSFATQIARALDYAHRRGIVHRDVKPANILIARDGTAIVTDFGIARMQAAGRLTTKGAIIGTPHYMSPEQARGELVDYRADLYSLGCVLFQMVTGRLPFDAGNINALVYKHIYEPPPSPSQWRPEIPKELESAILRLMAKSPADRFPDAQSVIRTFSRTEMPAEQTPSPELMSLASSDVAGTVEWVNRPDSPDRKAVERGATQLVTRGDLPFGPDLTAPSTSDEPAGKVSLEELSSMALKNAHLPSDQPTPVHPAEPSRENSSAKITLQELAALAVQTQHARTHVAGTPSVASPLPAEIHFPEPSAPLTGRVSDDGEQKTILAEAHSFEQVGATRLVSLDELNEQKEPEANVAPQTPIAHPPASAPAPVTPGRLPVPALVATAGALVIVLLLVWFFAFRGTGDRQVATSDQGSSSDAKSAPTETLAPTPTVTMPMTTASPTGVQPAENDWLARAEGAFRARRLSSPEADNALYYYKKAAETADTRAQAEQGIQRVARAYADLGRSAENSGQKEKARAYFMKALDIDPQLAEAWTAVNRLTQSRSAESAAAPDAARNQPGAARGFVEESPVAPMTPPVPAPAQGAIEKPPSSVVSPARTRPAKIYEITEVDKKPDALRQTAPEYPRTARQKGLEDIIVLRILISDTGEVLEAKVLREARVDAQFEKSALEAVRQWKFTPAMKSGRAVSVWYNVAVPFQLRK